MELDATEYLEAFNAGLETGFILADAPMSDLNDLLDE